MAAKKTKKRNPRSEAAMREAVKNHEKLYWRFGDSVTQIIAVTVDGSQVAIFDIRDCFRKRKPLTGIGKKLAKVVRTGK